MKFVKKAFTLTELIISIIISTLVLGILLSFVSNSLSEIEYSNDKTRITSQVNEFVSNINSYMKSLWTWTWIIDVETWSWTDIFLIKDKSNNLWVLFWLINPDTKQIFTPWEEYLKYNKKSLWYIELNNAQITDILNNPARVYSYNFSNDKIIRWIYFKDFQVTNYNSWNILELKLEIITNYFRDLEWTPLDELWNDEILELILEM